MPTLPPSYIERAGWHALIKSGQNVTEFFHKGWKSENKNHVVKVGRQLSILAQIELQMAFYWKWKKHNTTIFNFNIIFMDLI